MSTTPQAVTLGQRAVTFESVVKAIATAHPTWSHHRVEAEAKAAWRRDVEPQLTQKRRARR